MKIKLLISRAGKGFVEQQGEIIEVSNDEAKRMIEAGQAEPVVKKAEKATAKGGEKR